MSVVGVNANRVARSFRSTWRARGTCPCQEAGPLRQGRHDLVFQVSDIQTRHLTQGIEPGQGLALLGERALLLLDRGDQRWADPPTMIAFVSFPNAVVSRAISVSSVARACRS